MLNSFFQAICRVGIFMICAQALLHFRAQETYEKYLKMLVSIMILIQLFIPVGAFFMGEKKDETAEALRQFKQDMEAGIQAAEENAAAADAILEQMTLEEVQSRMEEQAAEQTEEQEDHGTMTQNSGRENIEVEPIEPVSVGTGSPETQEGR
nr:stage III sporulation protein AF [uncultured Acetatifactor sp.]